MADTVSNPSFLETSRLVVELIHASYATRRMDAVPAAMRAEPASGGETTGLVPPLGAGPGGRPISNHAIRAMIHLHQHGERTIGQLASGLGISFGWASRVVDELDANGTVIRERDARDRRVVRVRLTPRAIAEAERVYQWRQDVIEQALEGLTEGERAAVNTFLRRVTQGLLTEAGAFERRDETGDRADEEPSDEPAQGGGA